MPTVTTIRAINVATGTSHARRITPKLSQRIEGTANAWAWLDFCVPLEKQRKFFWEFLKLKKILYHNVALSFLLSISFMNVCIFA